MDKIEFLADKVRITGPKADESYSVTFDTGEYEREKIARLFLIEPGKTIKIIVEI